MPPTNILRVGWLAPPAVLGTAAFASTSLPSMLCLRCCTARRGGLRGRRACTPSTHLAGKVPQQGGCYHSAGPMASRLGTSLTR